MNTQPFSWSKLGMILLLTLAVGIGAYFVAWQFNDGKMTKNVYGSILLGMALPSLLMGGIFRLFRPDLQRYFAITGLGFLLAGLVVILS